MNASGARDTMPMDGDQATGREYASRLWLGLLSPEECAMAVQIGTALHLEPARVQSGQQGVRVGEVAWMHRNSSAAWIFERIERAAREYAAEMHVDVEELCDTMQFVKYGPGGCFNWHIDTGPGEGLRRKITICTQLTDARNYDGGTLELVGEEPVLWRRAIGSATTFPSILGHRLTPVTRGTRYALVAWMLGPRYR